MILSRPLYDALEAAAARHGVNDGLLAALVQRESGWNPDAVSPDGHGVGLGQLDDRGAGAGMTVAQRQDPGRNLDTTAHYLAFLIAATPTLDDALSAYNQGLAGWKRNGILASQRPYIADIHRYWDAITAEGLGTVDGAIPPAHVTLTLPRPLAVDLLAALTAAL